MMLVRSGDLRSRLLRDVVPLPYIHIGQHWRADPRSRWDTVMSSRLSFGSGAGQAGITRLASQPARNSGYELWVCLSSLELF